MTKTKNINLKGFSFRTLEFGTWNFIPIEAPMISTTETGGN